MADAPTDEAAQAEVLLRRAHEAVRGPDGCWVAEGEATWKHGGWDAHSHGTTRFRAVLEGRRWQSYSLSETEQHAVVDGQPTDRPLTRQFRFVVGLDRVSSSSTVSGLMANGFLSLGVDDHREPRLRPTENPLTTVHLERTGNTLEAHQIRDIDDGPGRPAQFHWTAVFAEDGTGPSTASRSRWCSDLFGCEALLGRLRATRSSSVPIAFLLRSGGGAPSATATFNSPHFDLASRVMKNLAHT